MRPGSGYAVRIAGNCGLKSTARFRVLRAGENPNTIALGGARLSKLVLPVLAGVSAQGTPLHAPTALRGEPSRIYQRASNGG